MKMRKIKKSLMACLIAIFALTLGAGFAFMPKANTAKAAVATEYTVVEAPMMGGIQDCYAAGGNLNLFITIPGLDNEVDGDGISFEGVDLASVFNSFGFFDNVMIGGKTLRELGCTSFWDNALGYNIGEPKPRVYLHAHFDPTILAAAIEDGTVNFAHTTMSTITFKEGTIIPGYRYLKGLDNAVLYKAGCEYNTEASTFLFERTFIGKTEVQSLKYIQDNGDGTGYFGISLFGDDYAGVGAQEDGVGNNLTGSITTWYHNDTVLLNGEAGKVGNYSLINLGDKGKGYYAFNVRVSEAELTSVTIPAGTKFPMYFYRGAQGSGSYNGGNKVVSYYEIKTTKTFVKDEYGVWYCPEDVVEIETEVVMAKAFYGDGVGADYFLNFELSVHDYTGLNTYGGNVQSVSNDLVSSNLKTHILVNGEVLPAHGESYLNVWGVENVFSTRGFVEGLGGFTNATQVETITILAGAKFPSHELLETGVRKYYVTTEDVTFVKVAELEWTVQVAFDLEAYKAEKTAEIEAYKAGLFLEEQTAQRAASIATATAAINEAADKETIDAAVATAKAEIDALPTASELLEEQLRASKTAAIAELNAYLADGEYTALQNLDRTNAINKGVAAINAAGSEEAIAEALSNAKEAVDVSIARVANYVDVTAIVKVVECYKAGGNFYLFVVLPELEAVAGETDYGVKVGAVLDALGLWDNVYVGDKSLKEWGVTGGWDADTVIGYNCSEPVNNIYIHCHSEEWKTSDVEFTHNIVSNYDMTIKEGTLIPSQAYFAGEDTYDVYRVQLEMTSNWGEIAYSFSGHADTDVVDVQLAQDNGDSVYLAVGLSNNDYPAEGGLVEVADLYYGNAYNSTAYWVNVKINGANNVQKYAIYNLNEGGKGRIALTVMMPYAQIESITIPAGTVFPTYALQELKPLNNNNVLVLVLKTTKDVTFVKTADGRWVNVDAHRASAAGTLAGTKLSLAEEDYFASHYAQVNEIYAAGLEAINAAASVEEIDSALEAAVAAINAVPTKAGFITDAKAEISAYKADKFREAEEAQRLAIVEAAQAELDACGSEEALAEALAAAKAEVDALKTAAQYADEELAAQKASAREEVSNYLDTTNYYANEQAEIEAAIAAGHQAIAEATNEAEIAQAVVDAKADLDEILTKEEVVAQVKAELNAYKAEDVFRADEQAERDAIVVEALAALEGLTDIAEITAIVEEAYDAIDALTTNDEYVEIELASAKAAAKAEVEAYLADGDYIPSQIRYREEAVADTLAAIAAAKSVEEIAAAVEEGKGYIDAIAASVTVEDVAMVVYISDIHHAGGNLNMFISIPGYDATHAVNSDGVAFTGYSKEALEALFDDLGLFDMVYINDKSLREWGFVGFWNGSVGFNFDPLKPSIYLHLHTDNPEYAAAVEAGEITFTKYVDGALSVFQSPVTVKQGLFIPGYSYLNEDDNAVVYRAVATFVTEGAHRPFDIEAKADTTVESIAYVQEDRPEGVFVGGYLGFSLEGDDFPAIEGDHIEVDANMLNYVNFGEILINGEAGLASSYSLYNLGEKGKGRISIAVSVAEEDMQSVTIPAGVLFPAYASKVLPATNGNNGVFVFYRIAEEVTFIKTAEGEWVKFTDFVQNAKDTLDELKAEKETLGCFAADLTLIETTVADAKAALDEATDPAEVTAIFNNARAIIEPIQAKEVVIAAAKADVENYKAGLFREAEEAQRLAAVENANTAIDAANSSEDVAIVVADAKAVIDALKTANEYAKEEIAEDVAEAKEALDAYKADADLYREEEAAQRLAIIEDAKAALDEALSIEEVEAIVADAMADIDALKTDAELDAEEALAAVKEEAIAEIGAMKAQIDLSLYTEESILTISTLYNDAKTAIEAATTEEAVADLVEKFEADLDAVPMIGEEPTSAPASESKSSGGCFGDIGGLSSVFALLSVMAVAVVLKKRR